MAYCKRWSRCSHPFVHRSAIGIMNAAHNIWPLGARIRTNTDTTDRPYKLDAKRFERVFVLFFMRPSIHLCVCYCANTNVKNSVRSHLVAFVKKEENETIFIYIYIEFTLDFIHDKRFADSGRNVFVLISTVVYVSTVYIVKRVCFVCVGPHICYRAVTYTRHVHVKITQHYYTVVFFHLIWNRTARKSFSYCLFFIGINPSQSSGVFCFIVVAYIGSITFCIEFRLLVIWVRMNWKNY